MTLGKTETTPPVLRTGLPQSGLEVRSGLRGPMLGRGMFLFSHFEKSDDGESMRIDPERSVMGGVGGGSGDESR